MAKYIAKPRKKKFFPAFAFIKSFLLNKWTILIIILLALPLIVYLALHRQNIQQHASSGCVISAVNPYPSILCALKEGKSDYDSTYFYFQKINTPCYGYSYYAFESCFRNNFKVKFTSNKPNSPFGEYIDAFNKISYYAAGSRSDIANYLINSEIQIISDRDSNIMPTYLKLIGNNINVGYLNEVKSSAENANQSLIKIYNCEVKHTSGLKSTEGSNYCNSLPNIYSNYYNDLMTLYKMEKSYSNAENPIDSSFSRLIFYVQAIAPTSTPTSSCYHSEDSCVRSEFGCTDVRGVIDGGHCSTNGQNGVCCELPANPTSTPKYPTPTPTPKSCANKCVSSQLCHGYGGYIASGVCRSSGTVCCVYSVPTPTPVTCRSKGYSCVSRQGICTNIGGSIVSITGCSGSTPFCCRP